LRRSITGFEELEFFEAGAGNWKCGRLPTAGGGLTGGGTTAGAAVTFTKVLAVLIPPGPIAVRV
jgi:hypothetical protein